MLTDNHNSKFQNSQGYQSPTKKSFESFITEFRDKRENVIDILKIIIEQRKTKEFTRFISLRKEGNEKLMRDFISSKYFHFVKSMNNVNECKTLIGVTDEVLNSLESVIQDFLSDFSAKYLDKIRKKEQLTTIKEEKLKLHNCYIFFAYLNKATVCLKEGQFESTIRLMNTAKEKYLNQFPPCSAVFKRGEEQLLIIKNKITHIIEEKLTNWLISISKEQNHIGETFYKKLRSEEERDKNLTMVRQSREGNEFALSEDKRKALGGKRNVRTTKNIVDNLLLIRNTSNLNYMMNKNSVLKTSVLNQAEVVEEFDILNMVSNIDLNFLEQAYSVYKKVDIDTKFIQHFINFRQSQLLSILKLRQDDNKTSQSVKLPSMVVYENYFSEILGYLIIQVSVFEILPVFYSKRKFEDLINYFIKEVKQNLLFEFNNLSTFSDILSLEQHIFLFIKAVDRIGIAERIGIDIRSYLIELMREKAEDLNFILINKYNNIFVNLLCEEKCLNIEIRNQEEFMKYVTQYLITLEENSHHIDIKSSSLIYPFKLPYTMFVVDVNEHFKKYVDEIFEFIQPLYDDYNAVMKKFVGHFLKKFNEVFHTFSNFQEQDLNIILAAHICNNIKYISKSRNFFTEYVMKKCNYSYDDYTTQMQSPFMIQESLKKTWENYEEIIFENLKDKIRQIMSELIDENWLPDRKSERPHMYVEGMLSYLSIIYESLQNISPFYIQTCFKDALDYIPKIYLHEILLNSKTLKTYNYHFVENLRIDIETIDEFLNKISLNHIGFANCLNAVKIVIMIFYSKKIDHFVDKNKHFDSNWNFKIPNLIEFLHKYKNLKKSEMKGKITESEISSIIKKLKELTK